MFSSILDCPECEHRFNFEHDDGTFPEIISCPACGISRGYREFSALLFCPGCRTKIKVPLDMVFDENIRCPKCNAAFNTGQNLLDDDYGSTLDGIGNCTASKRVLQDGDIFDKYRIISLLGRGGMAEVYLAEHLLLKQLCALKLMRDNHAADDKMYVKRFLREARLLHRLSHPNIVKVYDAGNDFKTGYFFIAMEYVEGQTLLQIANEQKLDESYLEIVLVSMVNALKCLNEANVVHRDIKPSNIMLDKNGVFRLMDLGIAKSESNHPAGEMILTMEQSTMGTPSYASPEQCQSAHSVDIRSDIYSLGATLYHAASGKLPYDGTTAVEIILKVIRGEREPLKNLRPDLSAGFLDLIDRMMLKDPSARPASPDEILSLLQKESGGAAGKVTGILGSGTKKLLQLLLPGKQKGQPGGIIRIGRLIFALILLAVIAVNFKYIHNYYKKRSEEDKINSYNAEKPYNPLAGKFILPKYPDPYSELGSSFVFRNGKSEIRYPKVAVEAMPEENLVFDYDFKDKIPPEDSFPSAIISNGAACLNRLSELNTGKKIGVVRAGIEVPRMLHGYTLSVTFRMPPEGDESIFKTGSIFVMIYQKKLFLMTASGYVAVDWNVPPEKWTNITISCDAKAKRLTIFAGKVFIGSYLIEKRDAILFNLQFGGMYSETDCRIGYVTLYDQPLTLLPYSGGRNTYVSPESGIFKSSSIHFTLPVKPKSNFDIMVEKKTAPAEEPQTAEGSKPAEEPKPAEESKPAENKPAENKPAENKPAERPKPAVVQPAPVSRLRPVMDIKRDITPAEQLDLMKQNYAKFVEDCRRKNAAAEGKIDKLSRKDRILLRQLIKCREDLCREWQARIGFIENRNRKISAARSAKYDPEEGKKLQRMFEEYTARHRDWGIGGYDREFSNDLQKMIRKESVDPNIEVKDSAYRRFSGPLIYSVTSGRIANEEKIFRILISRWADPLPLQKMINRSTAVPDLIKYGLPANCLEPVISQLFNINNRSRPDLKILAKILFFDGGEFSADHLIAAVFSNRIEVVQLLLAAGVNPNLQDQNGETALFYTYRINNGQQVRRLLLLAGADPDIRNNRQKKASDFASTGKFYQLWIKNDLTACRKMLQEGINADLMLPDGNTLLADACKKVDIPAIRMLLEFKADPNFAYPLRPTPMQSLFRNFPRYRNLNDGNKQKEFFEVIKMMINAGGDIGRNPQGYGGKSLNMFWYFIYQYSRMPEADKMALFMLAHTGNFEDAHWDSMPYALLHVDHRDLPLSTTRKIFAAIPENLRESNVFSGLYSGYSFPPKRLEKLLRRGKVNNLRVVPGVHGSIPMLYAAVCGKQPPEVIKALLDAGADPDWRDRNGKRAADIATDKRVKKMLLNHRGGTRRK